MGAVKMTSGAGGGKPELCPFWLNPNADVSERDHFHADARIARIARIARRAFGNY